MWDRQRPGHAPSFRMGRLVAALVHSFPSLALGLDVVVVVVVVFFA